MNALRSAAALRPVRVTRVHITPSPRSAHSHHPFWHRAAVRTGPQHSLGRRPPRPIPLNNHSFRHLSQTEKSVPPTTAPKEATPAAPKAAAVSNAEQRRRDWAIVRRLAVHIWPKNDWGTRGRVVLGVGLLVSGKVRHLGCLARVSSQAQDHPS